MCCAASEATSSGRQRRVSLTLDDEDISCNVMQPDNSTVYQVQLGKPLGLVLEGALSVKAA